MALPPPLPLFLSIDRSFLRVAAAVCSFVGCKAWGLRVGCDLLSALRVVRVYPRFPYLSHFSCLWNLQPYSYIRMIHIVAWMYELCAGRVRLWMTSIDCRHPRRPCRRRRRRSRWRCFSPFFHVTLVWSFSTDNPRFLFDVICTMIDSRSFSSLGDRFVLPNVVNRVNGDRLIIVRSFVSGSDLRKRNFGLSIVLGSIVPARVRYVERENVVGWT